MEEVGVLREDPVDAVDLPAPPPSPLPPGLPGPEWGQREDDKYVDPFTAWKPPLYHKDTGKDKKCP